MFSFSYHLDTAGWADATLADGTREIELVASYLSDALGDLTRAAIALLQGADVATFAWLAEPGRAEWRLVRHGDQTDVTITIFADGHTYLIGQARHAPQTFTIRCPLTRFANEVLDELWQVLEEVGLDGYKERWKAHDFPLTEYEELRRLLRFRKSQSTTT